MENDGNCSSSTLSQTGAEDSRDDVDRILPPETNLTYDPTSMFYETNGRKLMYIFNHETYKEKFKPRNGTQRDVQRLQETFDRPDRFEVEEPYNDYTHEKIIAKINDIHGMDHSRTACIAIVILTHGEKDGKVWSYDRLYPLSDIFNPVMKSPGLAGKPKLFFIQACRGDNLDPGMKVQIDSGRSSATIPTHQDCLVLRSSYEDYVSFRNGEGSWMIQTLCDVIDREYNSRHLVDIMHLVNAQIAKRNSSSSDPKYNEKYQISVVDFTFTKFLKF